MISPTYMHTCIHVHMLYTCRPSWRTYYMTTCCIHTAWLYPYLHTYIPTWIQLYLDGYMPLCLHTVAGLHSNAPLCTYVLQKYTHVPTSTHANTNASMHAYMRTSIRAFRHRYTHPCIHTRMHTCMDTCLHTDLHAWHAHLQDPSVRVCAGWKRVCIVIHPNPSIFKYI